MKSYLLVTLFGVCAVPLLSQSPAPAAVSTAPQVHSSEFGFSYSVPADWEVEENRPTAPVTQQVDQNATDDAERKGLACVQIPLTARHGDPASVLTEVALPFSCIGQELSKEDLPGFAAGASNGLKQTFNLGEPVYGSYSLGTHSFWIERAKGTPKGNAEVSYTVEIACSLLKKAAVCWMAMVADDAALKTFEQGPVTLDGEPPVALVPATVFEKKPS